MRLFSRAVVVLLAATLAMPAGARDAGLKLDRVVLLMRHGVRPPTKAPAMPAGIAAEAWPGWPVAPGWLTPHGAEALERLAAADRAHWIAAGLLPASGCGSASVHVVADSDERTIATGEVYGAGIAGGCPLRVDHRAQGAPDPLFSPIDQGAVPFDPEAANAAVLAALGAGGVAAVEARHHPVLARLDAILCGAATQACGITGTPSALTPGVAGKRPKLTGALDRGSTVAQILLLEYADGKPMAEVGWGRATAADIAAASALHAEEFALLARPAYLARHNAGPIAAAIGEALGDDHSASATMFSGHDTTVASLGGLLGVHWHVPGFAADDPAPGGALVFERLSDGRGNRYVRAEYRSQTLDQMRALTLLEGGVSPYRDVLPILGCAARGVTGLCTLAQFRALLEPRRP